MKIAILHEMLVKLGGAEKVVEELIRIFPEAHLYTLIYDEKKAGEVFPKNLIHQSCFSLPSQKRYSLLRRQKLCLPKMSQSVEMLDFSSYDILIISSSGFAHGAITKPECRTLVYYHAPARYLWDWAHEYRRELGLHTGILGYFFGKYLKKLREWDYIASKRPDILLSNSKTTQSRIWKYYRRNSQIVFPPIDTKRFQKDIGTTKLSSQSPLFLSEVDNKYYIILSALTEFKRINIAIKNFTVLSDINLLIIGEGSQKKELEKLAGESKNIIFTGARYGDELVTLVQNSLGLIFPGEEDFGIVPIEVMAAGKPVFALYKGGLTETVVNGVTGAFFEDSQGGDFIQNFNMFHKNNLAGVYTSEECKKQAAYYDKEVFKKTIQGLILKE
ncbi:glycosyltransferase [Candidatus Gracilibacteria bacterium]|nr:glycosyltransferase [Candidatus Gracilibacteria bacterium]